MLINGLVRAGVTLMWAASVAGATIPATARRAPAASVVMQAGRSSTPTDTTRRTEIVRVTDTAAIRIAVEAALVGERNSEERMIRRWVIISLIALGGAFLLFLGYDFAIGREVWIETHWGGLGGGVGGVRVSRPFALLVLLLVAGSMLTAVTMMGSRGGTSPADSKANEKTPAAGAKASSPTEPATSGRGG